MEIELLRCLGVLLLIWLIVLRLVRVFTDSVARNIKSSNMLTYKAYDNITKLGQNRDCSLVKSLGLEDAALKKNFTNNGMEMPEWMVYPVGRYTSTANTMLPWDLIRRLTRMTPKQFRKFVSEELSQNERESIMLEERFRRLSFPEDWPYNDCRSAIEMASSGFYYTGTKGSDRVQCVFCRGSLHEWRPGETPPIEHRRHFVGTCPFVNGYECGNIPVRPGFAVDLVTVFRNRGPVGLENDEFSKHITWLGPRYHNEVRRNNTVDLRNFGISRERPVDQENALEANRRSTFNLLLHPTVSVNTLAQAGFSYTGIGDEVRCFFCAGTLRSWERSDDPWIEHARYFPWCPFILESKGFDFVNRVQATTPVNNSPERNAHLLRQLTVAEVEHNTEQDCMKELCVKFGHKVEIVKYVIDHFGPFDSIGQFIDAIYKVGSNETDEVVIANSDSLRNWPQPVDDQSHKGYCKVCLRDGRGKVPVTFVGLPCGHLIVCDSCKVNLHQGNPRCPYPRCNVTLAGVLRVYMC